MFCYLWYEKSDPSKVKFGERWVFSDQDPETEVWKRIKGSLGVRKDILKTGGIELARFWDVTELSKTVDRYYQRSRMDDYLRENIHMLRQSRVGTTGEIHNQSADDVIIAVNSYLAKQGQPLPYAGLAQWQYDAAEDVLNAVADNKQIILAELCARFGKTIWIGALIREMEVKLTVVVSYVLTSFKSFIKDLSSFEQFKDLVLVDTKDDDYTAQTHAALAEGKQVVAFVSMCKGSKRRGRLEFLFNLPVDRLVAIDEADFGMKQAGQSTPLIESKKDGDVVIIMTGTNADQAGQHWKNAHYLSCTYPELILAKRNSLQA